MLDPDMIFFDKTTHSQVLMPPPPASHSPVIGPRSRQAPPHNRKCAPCRHLPLTSKHWGTPSGHAFPSSLVPPPDPNRSTSKQTNKSNQIESGKQYSRRAEGMVVIPYNFTVPRYHYHYLVILFFTFPLITPRCL
jgi:hypothetical protein